MASCRCWGPWATPASCYVHSCPHCPPDVPVSTPKYKKKGTTQASALKREIGRNGDSMKSAHLAHGGPV